MEIDLSKELTAPSPVKERQVEEIQVCRHYKDDLYSYAFDSSFFTI